MLLSAKQIKERNLIKWAVDTSYFGASYNLTIGEIMSINGESHYSYSIPPRGMVLVISNEILNLPPNIIGYTTVKNALSMVGILAVNIGIVDQDWKNPISSLLINFGSVTQLITVGDTFLRMTFHEFEGYDKEDLEKINTNNEIDEKQEIKTEDYINSRKRQAVQSLSTTFLSITQIKNEIANKAIIRFFAYVGAIAAFIAVLSFIYNYTEQFKEFKKQKKEILYSKAIDSLNEKIRNIEYRLSVTNTHLNKNERDTLGNNVKRSLESKRK